MIPGVPRSTEQSESRTNPSRRIERRTGTIYQSPPVETAKALHENQSQPTTGAAPTKPSVDSYLVEGDGRGGGSGRNPRGEFRGRVRVSPAPLRLVFIWEENWKEQGIAAAVGTTRTREREGERASQKGNPHS